MNKMTVSPWFSISPEGPITCATDENPLVHLRQGELDGACGPYCMVMALIALGVLSREEACNMSEWDARTREGRFRDKLKSFGTLVNAGTDTYDLTWLAEGFARKGVWSEEVTGSKKSTLKRLIKAVDDWQIPILSLYWESGSGHWLIVVGYQGIEYEEGFQLTHLLCLDPASEAPYISLWNAVIEVFNADGESVNKGTYSANHWDVDGYQVQCQISTAVILGVEE